MAETYYSLTDIVKLCDNLIAALPPSFYSGIMAVRTGLANISAADVVPVVHGKWVQKRKQTTIDSYWIRWECSECGYCRTKGWEHSSDGKKPRAKLCEMCGALMDKDGDANVQNWEKNHLRPTNMSGTNCEPCKPTQPECGDCEYIKDGAGE